MSTRTGAMRSMLALRSWANSSRYRLLSRCRNARALAGAARLTEQLEKALNSRAVIDQAIGVLISRTGCTGAEGYDKLRSLSQAEHKKVAVVAEAMVGEAKKTARTRRRT
ncbi:ANTAR domain-containing protein [Rhodococcoides navarretei]|uniref:ANTAR domain-containing protein n=1 Tax=Rhodococcus navarretei TaxID=3128981 RepID=A0ABU9D469_9NOCA